MAPKESSDPEISDFEKDPEMMKMTWSLMSHIMNKMLRWDIPGETATAHAFPIRSPDQVRKESDSMAKRIFQNYETLNAILQRHEPTIHNRWLKKNRRQKLAILLEGWPNMPAQHRPDIEVARQCAGSKKAGSEREQRHREALMSPYINQEDLLVPKALLLLINSRGRHAPSYFAGADLEAMSLALRFRMIDVAKYGKLLEMCDEPEAYEWWITEYQFEPGDGLLVLEAQDRLLSFLVHCCQQILHDIPESTMVTDLFPVLPEPLLGQNNKTVGFESLVVLTAEAPFRVPAKLDLSLVESLLTARSSAAEDHLWALREDPDYFAKRLLEAKDHRREMLKDPKGNRHPLLLDSRNHIIWARSLESMLVEAHVELETFSELSRQAKQVALLQVKHSAVILPSQPLPDEYLEALLTFRYFITDALKKQIHKLVHAAPLSRPLRNSFRRLSPSDLPKQGGALNGPSFDYTGDERWNRAEGRLVAQLNNLSEERWISTIVPLPILVDELERIVQSAPGVKDLLSPYVTRVLGTVSILSQCLHQLHLYQPWARTWESEVLLPRDSMKAEFNARTKPSTEILAALNEDNLKEAASLCDPSGGRFHYPFEKRRTKENVNTLRKAERHLDDFWQAVDKVLLAKVGDLRDTAVGHLLYQSRILRRTLEWTEPENRLPAPAERSQATTSERDIYASYQAISMVYRGLSAKELDVPHSKAKVKTRGAQQPQDPAAPTGAMLQLDLSDSNPTFAVDSRALKVFRAIFFNPAISSTPGEVPWSDFLHAMVSVGFKAIKLYGSVWQFRPTLLDVERSIQFHEPHPTGKLAFYVARRYGRRLYRAYGWVGETFVLAGK
ncbi:uncharacterized protein DSM5745_00718 [Aspergillus mulundensis]|uniref:Uncharacterized protein n=1 Tax=Aspergillus mulundensis TaxID=1810919 RepID=A0A3D8T4B2_9EURO|nr:hypothetical protein DSM5745_00718 [Aspergillus mulundensis]RDW93396.1 hypothetical protein DSM5745_00718 [Aspergillus mulundensis]